jgi:hypothetical protein
MSGIQNFWCFEDDFIGGGIFGTSATAFDPWVITDTSAAGTPTYTRLDHGETAGVFRPGVARLLMASNVEAENVCLSFGDKLCFDIDKIQGFECALQLVPGGTLKDATTTLAWGLAGDRNDAIDTIAIAALFRLADGTAVNTVVVESDDATNNNDDVATGQSLVDGATNTNVGWHRFKIDFSNGKKDVRFFMSDSNDNVSRVAAGTTFDMSNYSAGLQPFFQLQKTSDSNVDAVEIDYVKIWGTR